MIAFLGSCISSLKVCFADFGTVQLKYYDYMKCILVFDDEKRDMYSQKVHEIFKINTRLTFSQFQSCYKCKCNSSEVKSNASKMCALMQKSIVCYDLHGIDY